MTIDYSALAQNLRLVASRQPDAAEYFLALLFRQCPATEKLFPRQPSPAQLATAFERALASAQGESSLSGMFRAIGERHRGQGASGELYRAAADALMSILILVSADAWTPALHSLWRSACAQFISWMTAGLGTPPARPATTSPSVAQAVEAPTTDCPYLLVLAGPSRGEVIPLGRNVTIGSGDDVDLHIPDATVSREHARIVRGTLALHLTDLQSGGGTRLNGLPVSRPTVLNEGDQISLGGTTLMLFTYQQGLEQQLRTGLFHRATHDPVTQAYTREYFGERLVAEVAFARRHEVPLAVLLIQPRSRADEAAPAASRDVALRKVARRIKPALRAEDVLARYDENRLIIFCRNLKDQQALLLARRLRQLVASPPSHVVGTRVGQSRGTETVSIGISSFIHSRSSEFRDSFLFSAEIALYRANHLGPGRIVVAGEMDPS